MAKNVLIISSSPRKNGNSDLLCDRFAQGAQEAEHTVEKIFLNNEKIGYCLACYYCVDHNGECTQKDDMTEILDKMIKADVIVLASPVYFYTINAKMKTLIDRSVARWTEINNKEFYYIVTAADTDKSNLELSVNCFRGFARDCLSGAIEKGVIYASNVDGKGDVKHTAAWTDAYNMGQNV